MPLTLPFKSNLAATVSATTKSIRLQDSTVDLCAALAAPAHAFATIYTINKSERVLVYGCGVDGTVTVTRGVDGTTARSWPANACVKITEILPGAVCADDDGEDDLCGPFDPVAAIPLGKGLRWDVTDTSNPKLTLAPTGVVPANMACGELNECGQIVSLPANWPASCMTPFDPCCDTGGSAPAPDACDVPYATNSGSGIVTGGTVCDALDQLADAIGQLSAPTSVVAGLTEGACVNITGTAANPVVGVAPSGITAGTYAGFQINECGQVVSYTAQSSSVVAIVGTSPITVSFASDTYTISAATAGVDQLGVVQLADPAEAANATPTVADDDVITWEFLQLWATTQGIV